MNSPTKFLKYTTLNNKIFFDKVINRTLRDLDVDNVQIYPNFINIILDIDNNDNPINKAVNKRDYFTSLNKFENTKFQYLKNFKPSKVIKKYNKSYISNIIKINERAIKDKNINKYIHKKISKKLIIFFVDLTYLKFNRSGRIKIIPGHRSLFLYDSYKNKSYYIDPDFDQTKINTLYMKNKSYKEALLGYRNHITEDFTIYKLNKIISKILKIENVKITIPEYYCPQSRTKDNNCVFWTLFLAEEYIKYFLEYSEIIPEEVLDNLYKNYPTVKDLNDLIKNYKKNIYILTFHL